MPEEHNADQRDYDAFFDELLTQRIDRVVDQFAAVIYRHHAHTLGQRRLDFLKLPFYPINDGERVLAIAHYDNAANDLALAIKLRHSAPDVRTEMHSADVTDVNRRSVLDLKHDVFDVARVLDVAMSADEILLSSYFEHLATDISVAHLYCLDDVAKRDVVGQQFIRIEVHLVLLDESADCRDLGHALDRFERVTQMPVLIATQCGKVVFAALVHECVFKHPAHARSVRADYGIHAFGQHSAHGIQVFN